VDVVFDGRYYYMVSTTMYFAPSVPIMRTDNLVGWSIVGYTGPLIDDTDALALRDGAHAYGQGTWAASIAIDDGVYYVSVASLTTDKTYIYATRSIEDGPWTRSVLDGYAHDQSLLFDGDAVYLICGGGSIDLRRLTRTPDGTFAWDGPATRLVDDASIDAREDGLGAEGAHAYRLGDYYYVFMIEWPAGGIRQEVLWRSRSLTPLSQGGAWEGRVVLSRRAVVGGVPGTGVAQGGVVRAADGQWYAMLFQDQGALGRCPQLARVAWGDDGWPTIDLDDRVPVPGAADGVTDVVVSDEFDNRPLRPGYWNVGLGGPVLSAENAWNGSNLGLQWQWNHNPDNRFWSLTQRPGYLRLTMGSLATGILDARNTLTQRMLGPASSATVAMDVSHLRDGDVAGLGALQARYGYLAVVQEGASRHLVMRRADAAGAVENVGPAVALRSDVVYLRVSADFRAGIDRASFAWSLDNESWTRIGDHLAMEYSLAHFTGYRFAIFAYSTRKTGGHVDVDWFHIDDRVAL
jgi:beta-xylosidase